MIPKVKICGITNLKDAINAVKFGADALGFVFYDKSPRYITPRDACEIVQQLPPFVHKVGLFVNETASDINSICAQSKMSIAQIHFSASDLLYDSLDIPHIKVIRAKSKEDIQKHKDEYRIVDAFVHDYGGAGKRVESLWFKDIDCSKIILAGGLNAKNIDEVKEYGFYGFDVSSGVERAKGKKDRQKMKDFIQKAKA